MANFCKTYISVVGVKDPPDIFVKALSKTMFDIDLDNMDVEKWGHKPGEDGKFSYYSGSLGDPNTRKIKTVYRQADPKTWYTELVNNRDIELCVLYPAEPVVTSGVSVPCFFVETKWEPPHEEMKKASEAFPDMIFHADWFVEDRPSGEFVFKDGKLLERTESDANWHFLFDELKYPSMSLLHKYMTLTLAQRGAAAVHDAIDLVKKLHYVIHDPRFAASRYQPWRDARKYEETREALDALLVYMEEAAKSLTFDGVFLPDMTDAKTESLATPPVSSQPFL